ncbi:MAG: hypothetical protein L0191_02055 [Acidobacteria bacterium]|nr:hypothetical protein [Acidobacteriota bacterium]
MKEPTLEDLTHRVGHLERENRRLKRVGAMVALGIAAVVLMGQVRSTGKVVEAEEFVLQDPAAKHRGVLSVLPDGTPDLAFHDSDGKRTWQAP